MSVYFYDTNIGNVAIREENGYITNVYFNKNSVPKECKIEETEVLKEAGNQLNKYLNGELRTFKLPINAEGTDFMNEVWKELCDIPYGYTLSYKDVAERIGKPKASRAIGLACNRNPIPLFIPCHRVVGSNGKITGYLGGVDIKEKLLDMERINRK